MQASISIASAPPSSAIDRCLDRLTALQCSDPGIFVLSVHSFVEGWIRCRFGLDSDDQTFPILMDRFVEYVKKKSAGPVKGLDSMSAMVTAHHETHGVRHYFCELDRIAAETATQHLERFCFLANIGSPERLDTIKRYLSLWEDRRPLGALITENRTLRGLLGQNDEERRRLVHRVEEMSAAQHVVDHLHLDLATKDSKISELEKRLGDKDIKVDELRHERAETLNELRSAQKRLAEYEHEREYVSLARKMAVYTRTRADYERAIIRLTTEQVKVLEQIRLDADFLVKGAAGTGKTLVLLKAIEKAKAGGALGQLTLSDIGGSVALLTFNTTLVKYDRYIASILSRDIGADKIMTADAFIHERLAAIDDGAQMDYDIVKVLAERYCPPGFSPRELLDEAESVVWGNDLDFDSYVEGGFARTGMKKALAKADRGKLWAAIESMASEMESLRTFGKGYSRVKLLRAIEAAPDDPRIKCVDYIFIDETQDLSAADLKALKACARKCVVLAGDSDQSIYQPGFTFKQAGLDVVGRSRILRTNFRNSLPIHELAEAYRTRIPGQDVETLPAAFREGPAPELYRGTNRDMLLDLLVARVSFFLKYLDYDPENICILAPLKDDTAHIKERLQAAGYASADPHDRDFSFEAQGAIRVSTLHSAKGLDFPVVLLFLHRRPFVGTAYGEEAAERMARSLIYVGLTRAMDHLEAFTLEEPGSGAIGDLIACFFERDAAAT